MSFQIFPAICRIHSYLPESVFRQPPAREDSLFIFFLQLRDTLHGGRLYVFSILVAMTWALWAVKVVLSRRYQPWVGDYATTA